MNTYPLSKDGDSFEKHYHNLFIKNEFPSYEEFWQKFVVPLTNRPKDIHFKNDKELKQIKKTHNDICIAQLHYTVLKHLVRTFELRQIDPLNLDQFTEGIVRLSAALDVADELLERFTTKIPYDPWSENDGKKAREQWRKKNNQTQWLRNYRNRLLHGRICPAVIITGTYNRFRVPKFRKETDYLDWRKVTNASVGAGGKVRNDFDAPNNLLNHAWQKTLSYLEDNWRQHLL